MAMGDYSLSDIAAITEGGEGRNGLGDGGLWILLLFIILGGWGNRGFNGGGSSVGGNELYPWMENQGNLFNGFAGLTNTVTTGFAAAELAAANRQMDITQQFLQCCCENRLGLANLEASIAREACADRAAVSDGIRDLLTSQNASTQRILDQLCQYKIDAKNDEIAQLRQQVNNLNLAASQGRQTATILADNAAQTVALEQYLNPTPIPAYVVSNPNCCQPTTCGCGGSF